MATTTQPVTQPAGSGSALQELWMRFEEIGAVLSEASARVAALR